MKDTEEVGRFISGTESNPGPIEYEAGVPTFDRDVLYFHVIISRRKLTTGDERASLNNLE